MKNLFIILITFSTIVFSFAQNTTGYNLLAHYPLQSDGQDAMGNYADAELENAVFQNGGVYSNGIYGNNGTVILTPEITAFDNDDFIITIEVNPEINNNYLMMLDDIYRTLSLYLDYQGTLQVEIYLTGSFHIIYTNVPFNLNSWYKIGVHYTASDQVFKTYVNDNLVNTDTLTEGLYHSPYKNFVNYHGGYGQTFKGYWKNLKIYGTQQVNVENSILKKSVKIFPTLVDNLLYMENKTGKEIEVIIMDISGRIKQVINLQQSLHSVSFTNWNKGVYLLSFRDENEIFLQKIIKK